MADDQGTPQHGGSGANVPHPATDITATRRWIHPENPSMMGPFDAMNYNNMMCVADQNRQTHSMLEQLIAQGNRRARSASTSSRATPRVSAGADLDDEAIEDETAGPSQLGAQARRAPGDLNAIFQTHKSFLVGQFGR